MTVATPTTIPKQDLRDAIIKLERLKEAKDSHLQAAFEMMIYGGSVLGIGLAVTLLTWLFLPGLTVVAYGAIVVGIFLLLYSAVRFIVTLIRFRNLHRFDQAVVALSTQYPDIKSTAHPSPRASIYVYKCKHCGKRFRRNRPTLSLNPHMDKNRQPCLGREAKLVRLPDLQT